MRPLALAERSEERSRSWKEVEAELRLREGLREGTKRSSWSQWWAIK
jgi:hypothetical protein